MLVSIAVISVGPAWKNWGCLWIGKHKILITVYSPEKPSPAHNMS